MAQIRLITFDLDNTLWDVDTIIRRAEQEMRDWMADHTPAALDQYTPEQVGGFRAQIVERFPSKIHDLSFMRIQVLTCVMQAAGYSDRASQLAEAAFEVFFEGRNRVEFFTGALTTLASLRENYTLMALTNGNADIHRAGLTDYLHGAVSSADVGVSKPDPRMFTAPLDQLGLEPQQAIHVGDNMIDDVHGAHAVGLHTIWVNFDNTEPPAPVPTSTQVVSALPEIIDVVESLTS